MADTDDWGAPPSAPVDDWGAPPTKTDSAWDVARSYLPREIGDIPGDMGKSLTESGHDINAGLNPFSDEARKDVVEGNPISQLGRVGKGLVSAVTAIPAAASKLLSTPGGNLLARGERLIPGAQWERDNETPEQTAERWKGNVDTALMAARPGKGGDLSVSNPTLPPPPPAAPVRPPFGVHLSEGQDTGLLPKIKTEQEALRSGNPRAKAFEEQQLAERAQAHEDVARSLDPYNQRVAESPLEAADIVSQSIQQAQRAAKADVDAAYARARDFNTEVHTGVFEGIGNRVKADLMQGDSPVILDELTPNANKALKYIEDQVSNLKIKNKSNPFVKPDGTQYVPPDTDLVGVDLKGVDQWRKNLAAIRQDAFRSGTPSDQRAVRRIVNAFDEAVDDAFTKGLYRGDPAGAQAWKDARAAHADYAETFTGSKNNPVGKQMESIWGRNTDPVQAETVADKFFGNGVNPSDAQLGMLKRAKEMWGEGSPQISALKQGHFERLTTKPDGTPYGPADTRKRINRFLNADGRTYSRELYNPQDRALLQAYADFHRKLEVPQAGANWPNSAPPVKEAIVKLRDLFVGALGTGASYLLGMPPLVSEAFGVATGAASKVAREAIANRKIAKQMPLVADTMAKYQKALNAYNKRITPLSRAALTTGAANLSRALAPLGIKLTTLANFPGPEGPGSGTAAPQPPENRADGGAVWSSARPLVGLANYAARIAGAERKPDPDYGIYDVPQSAPKTATTFQKPVPSRAEGGDVLDEPSAAQFSAPDQPPVPPGPAAAVEDSTPWYQKVAGKIGDFERATAINPDVLGQLKQAPHDLWEWGKKAAGLDQEYTGKVLDAVGNIVRDPGGTFSKLTGYDYVPGQKPTAENNYTFTPDDLVPSSKKRVQLWPEVLVRSATTLPGDVTSGKVPATEFDPVTGETRSSPELIHRAQDLAGMAGGTSFGAAAGHVIPENALGMAGGNPHINFDVRALEGKWSHHPDYLYHGTSDLNLPSIEREGLRPGTHLTTDPYTAFEEARYTSKGGDPVDNPRTPVGGNPVVIPIHKSKLGLLDRFFDDPEYPVDSDWGRSVQTLYALSPQTFARDFIRSRADLETHNQGLRNSSSNGSVPMDAKGRPLFEDSALPGAPLAALERNATRAPHMAGRKLRDSFGEGWFYNPKQGKLHKIEASDLGPHGDHDGWISIGDNAERVGVDPKAAAAMQVATWGAHPDSPNPLIREFAEKHPPVDDFGTPQTHSYGNVENPTAYDRDFLQTFGIDPNTALDPARLGLTRVRKWPDGTLSVSAYSPSVNPRKLVSELIKSDPEVMTGVKSVGVESLDGNFRNLTPEQFLQGDWGTRSRTATFREDAATPGAPLAALERNAARAPHMAMEEAPTGNLPAPYKPQELGSDVQNFLRLSQGFEKKYGPDWVTRLTPEESAALRDNPTFKDALTNIAAAKAAGVLDKVLQAPVDRRSLFRGAGAAASVVTNASRLNKLFEAMEPKVVDPKPAAYETIKGLKDEFTRRAEELRIPFDQREYALNSAKREEVNAVYAKYGELSDYPHKQGLDLEAQQAAEIDAINAKYQPELDSIRAARREKYQALEAEAKQELAKAREDLALPKLDENQQKVLDYVVRRPSLDEFSDANITQNPYELAKIPEYLRDLERVSPQERAELEAYLDKQGSPGWLLHKMSPEQKAQIAEHIKPALLQDPHLSLRDARTIAKAFPSLKGFALFEDSALPGAPLAALQNQAKPFYSALERTVENAPQQKMLPSQWLGWLKNQPGVKAEELATSGLDQWGSLPKELVTKEQVLKQVRENTPQLGEKVLSGSRTRYGQYTLPGGENYREMVVTVPLKQERVSVGAAQPPGAEYGNTEFTANWEGRQRVEGVKEYPFKIGDQKGRITHWPDSSPEGEVYVVNSPNMQNAHFKTLEDAKAGIEHQFNQSGYMKQARKDRYASSHWPDQTNPLGHLRVNDRDIPGVGKSLHLEEVQSDWHQAGRRYGYLSPDKENKYRAVQAEAQKAQQALENYYLSLPDRHRPSLNEIQGELRRIREGREPMYASDTPEFRKLWEAYRDASNAVEAVEKWRGGVPNAPFKQSWPDLLLKRAIVQAAREGKDAISWTPGAEQAKRYSLENHVREIEYTPRPDDKYDVAVTDYSGRSPDLPKGGKNLSLDEVENIFGKEIAERMDGRKGKHYPADLGDSSSYTLSGLDLKIGGEGMKKFYDKMLVDKANALGKKYGAKVEQAGIETGKTFTNTEVYEALRARGLLPDEAGSGFNPWWRSLSNTQRLDYIKKAGLDFNTSVPVLRLTPQLKEAALKGLPLFEDSATTGAPLSALEKAPPFYSALDRVVEGAKQEKMHGSQWMGWLKNQPGVKQEELEWRGVPQWLDQQKGLVSKADLQKYLGENEVKVGEAKNTNRGPYHGDDDNGYAGEIADYLYNRWVHRPDHVKPTIERMGGHYVLRDGDHTISSYGSEAAAKKDLAEFKKALREGDTEVLMDFSQDAMDHVVDPNAVGKFSEYQLPGGTNYNELLLTLPTKQETIPWSRADGDRLRDLEMRRRNDQLKPGEEKEYQELHRKADARDKDQPYQSPHWDEPNVLAHVRYNDRTINGKKSLFLEEVQSDWHQAGRDTGYQGDRTLPKGYEVVEGEGGEYYRVNDANGYAVSSGATKEEALNKAYARIDDPDNAHRFARRPPQAPFKKSWPDLILKRMIREAAEKGYDQIAWTPGEVQAQRWRGTGEEGHQKFYDEILVNAANKIGKQYGAKVSQQYMDTAPPGARGSEHSGEVHVLPITPQLKEAALKGLPLFEDSATTGAPLSALEKAPPFYSALDRVVEGAKQEKMHGSQWMGWLKNQPGVKQEELEWRGVPQWLDQQKGLVSKSDLQKHLGENEVKVNDALNTNRGATPGSERGEEVIDQLLDRWMSGRAQPRIEQEGAHWVLKDGDTKLSTAGTEQAVKNDLKEFKKAIKNEDYEVLGDFAGYAVQFVDTGVGKYAEHQLPGGTNYNELLLTLPTKQETVPWSRADGDRLRDLEMRRRNDQLKPGEEKEYQELHRKADARDKDQPYQSPHWDEPNVLAHVRYNDRTINGKKSLFLEEVQSDWHQAGRKEGYKGDIDTKGWTATPPDFLGGWSVWDKNGDLVGKVHPDNAKTAEEAIKAQKEYREGDAVPNAPFKRSWPDLTLKRMIREAAEKGYDQIAWTPGEVQAQRWRGTGEEGHQKFYDEILVNAANKIGKPYGAKVSQQYMDIAPPGARGSEHSGEVHVLPITPELKKAVLTKGQPLFQEAGRAGAAVVPNEKRHDRQEVPGFEKDEEPQRRAAGGRVVASNINHSPSKAQKEAGNYAKEKVQRHGFLITIENAKGRHRSGVGKDGKPWRVQMPAHYGYLNGTVGKDKDHLDVYLGDHTKSPHAFIVDQVDPETKKFDEHKILLSFGSLNQALATYKRGFSDGKGQQRIGAIHALSLPQLKSWLAKGDTTKPYRV